MLLHQIESNSDLRAIYITIRVDVNIKTKAMKNVVIKGIIMKCSLSLALLMELCVPRYKYDLDHFLFSSITGELKALMRPIQLTTRSDTKHNI